MNANRQAPFDYDKSKVQRACRAILWLLTDAADEDEARRMILAVRIAAIGVPMTATSLPS